LQDLGLHSRRQLDVVVIGGGQAGLAVGYYLRRTTLRWIILDDQETPGGSWEHTWQSLKLFSPRRWSSLPGWLMPAGSDEYPDRAEVIAYLGEYERRYGLPVRRPVRVEQVRREGDALVVASRDESWATRAVISATGTWMRPFIPDYRGRDRFEGIQIHSANYRVAAPFVGKRVLIVGGGNSGAQILAELWPVADVTWVTREPPRLLPDHIDGRYLFDEETRRWNAMQEGRDPDPPTLGDIVMVAPVRDARDRGVLVSEPSFERFTERGVVWPDGREQEFDAVIWCTGYRPALSHLAPLGVIGGDGRIVVEGTRAVVEPRLWLVGYGDWTGYASATLIAVGRTARVTVDEVVAWLRLPMNAGEGS
jgi:cation diffusion facilitator CzcD-associated flavoprotein CzcO